MNKTIKPNGIMATIAIIVIAFALALATFACDDTTDQGDGTSPHTHTWSDWQSNADQHWKECSCGEKTDIGNHTGNPCTVCGYEEIATVPQPTQKILSFGKVIISSEDEHLPSAWIALCNDVVSSLETAYTSTSDPDDKDFFDFVCSGNGVEIVLVNSLATNWEVKQKNGSGKLYIKIGSISSITADSYGAAFIALTYNNPATSQD